MKIARIYTGADNQSHFEDLQIPLMPVAYGHESERVPAEGVIFRTTPEDGALGFHNPPRRQIVVTLSGLGEVECGDGSRGRFGPGDILLAEDVTGQGHITREIHGPRRGIFIPLPQEYDTIAWRVHESP